MKLKIQSVDSDFVLIGRDQIMKPGFGSDISGPLWMFMKISIRGQYSWRIDSESYTITDQEVWAYVPPYSCTYEYASVGTHLMCSGYLSKYPVPTSASCPMLYLNVSSIFPKTYQEIIEFFSGNPEGIPVPSCSRPTKLAENIKLAIDQNYEMGISMTEICEKLSVSPAVATRAFKKCYGYPPNYYKKGLRSTVGAFALLSGIPPIEAAGIAGFSDLSRFYKQFKQYLRSTPKDLYFKKR